MSGIISHVAFIEQDTGVIAGCQSYGSDLPAHNSIYEGFLVKHILTSDHSTLGFDPDNPATFTMEKVWKDNAWFHRGLPTNLYYSWNGTAWVVDTNRLNDEIRYQRNQKLYGTDWTQVSDSPLSDSKKAEWSTYRQSLRDIMDNLPSDLDDPDNVSWPTEPS